MKIGVINGETGEFEAWMNRVKTDTLPPEMSGAKRDCPVDKLRKE